MPNKLLAAALKKAKTASPDRRLFFALLPKGGTQGVLLVSPRKIPTADVQKAKKQLGASTEIKGTCYGANGKVVFETAKRPFPQWSALVRKLARQDAGIDLQAEFVHGQGEDAFAETESEVGEGDSPNVVFDVKDRDAQTQALAEVREIYQAADFILSGLQEKFTQDVIREHAKVFREVLERAEKLETQRQQGLERLQQEDCDLIAEEQTATNLLEESRQLARLVRQKWATQLWLQKIDLGTYTSQGEFAAGGQGKLIRLKSQRDDAPLLVLKTGNKNLLQSEADFYEKLGDHPNIARCLGIKNVGKQAGLVLESLPGGSMEQMLDGLRQKLAVGQLKQQEFWGCVQHSLIGMLQGLDYLHQQGFAHNDVKPANVMYDTDGQVKLIDLGSTNKLGERAGDTTGGYTPFESQLSRISNDLFGVGATTFKAGEDDVFDYNRKSADMSENPAKNYHQSGSTTQPDQALRPGTEAAPAGQVGRYGVQSAYVDFVNWLMHPDPTKRPTPAEALRHPFLRKRILDEEQARKVVQTAQQPLRPVVAPPVKPAKDGSNSSAKPQPVKDGSNSSSTAKPQSVDPVAAALAAVKAVFDRQGANDALTYKIQRALPDNQEIANAQQSDRNKWLTEFPPQVEEVRQFFKDAQQALALVKKIPEEKRSEFKVGKKRFKTVHSDLGILVLNRHELLVLLDDFFQQIDPGLAQRQANFAEAVEDWQAQIKEHQQTGLDLGPKFHKKHNAAAQAFREVSKKTHTTPEERKRLKAARDQFFVELDKLLPEINQQRKSLEQLADEIRQHCETYDQGTHEHLTNLKACDLLLQELAKAVAIWSRLKTLIESDKAAYSDLDNDELRAKVGPSE